MMRRVNFLIVVLVLAALSIPPVVAEEQETHSSFESEDWTIDAARFTTMDSSGSRLQAVPRTKYVMMTLNFEERGV